MSDAVAAVVAAMVAAFSDNPRPRPREMVYPGTWESRDLIRNLEAVDGEPDRAFIEQHFDSLAAFTPKGLRSVLPQYLRHSLENPDSQVTERIIYHLSPSDAESQYWQERLEAFSSAQRKAICECLRLVQLQLAGKGFDEDLARALSVWAC